MRYTNDPLQTAFPVVDATEVSAKAAVNPIRRVGDGTRGTSPQFPGQVAVGEGERQQGFYPRLGEDRRKMCRRIYHIPVLLDTRSGQERRQDIRRPDDPLTHFAKDV